MIKILRLARFLMAVAALAQTPVRPLGVVTAIDPATRQITLKTDAGPAMVVLVGEATKFQRVAPGEKDLANAKEIAFAEVAVGDRVLARGRMAADQRSVTASAVVVMTKADITRKQESERAEWQKRGVAGIITAVDAATRSVTINTRAPDGGVKPLTIVLAPNALLRRYAPDSVRFSDARPSSFAALERGDQVRALGARSADGATYTAEELVSGSFLNIAGTVVTADAAEGTLRINDLDSKKQVVVRITADSAVRKLQPMAAQMLAARLHGAALPGNGAGSSGPARSGAPDLQQLIERMPKMTLAELKPGDAIIVSATRGADAGTVTAITLLAGAEPILTTPAARQMTIGGWSLEMSMGGFQ
jgi:hypothetical protein